MTVKMIEAMKMEILHSIKNKGKTEEKREKIEQRNEHYYEKN